MPKKSRNSKNILERQTEKDESGQVASKSSPSADAAAAVPSPSDKNPREPGAAMAALQEIMTRLRAKDGCAWDAKQDLHTLRPYLIEESHEVLEVLDRLGPDGSGEWQAHRDELGDLLFQVVFQSEIQREAGRFDFEDVAAAMRDKLIRRHPHVFAGQEREEGSWERIKAAERAEKGEKKRRALDGVPVHLSALARAYRLGQKARAANFDWPDHSGVLDKIHEELGELEATLPRDGRTPGDKTPGDKTPIDKQRFSEEAGDLLYAIVNLCRHFEVDPEASLRGTMARFEARFAVVEDGLAADGLDAKNVDLDDLEARWQKAKRHLAAPPEDQGTTES